MDLFVATMIWGFGDKDEAGPVKLFLAVRTPGFDDTLKKCAEEVAQGHLACAFCSIRELNEIGPSFGTKFLYALGVSSQLKVKPLVLDGVVTKALQRGMGEDEANRRFLLDKLYYTSAKAKAEAGKAYQHYCESMSQWAKDLDDGITSEQLELFLFSCGKNL